MIIALMNGLIGLGLCMFLGIQVLNMAVSDVLICVLSSNFAALLGLLITLQAERIFKSWLNRSLKTWTLLIVLFLAITLSIAPPLRDLETFLYLLFPLILSTGFSILIFGPIQDRIMRSQQRRSLLQTSHKSESKDDFPCFPTDSAVL